MVPRDSRENENLWMALDTVFCNAERTLMLQAANGVPSIQVKEDALVDQVAMNYDRLIDLAARRNEICMLGLACA
jgi:hypothetical protein